jgi:zeta-carotene desaturase
MKKVIVVGGGLSGLSTAVFLANKGIKSHLIEASPKLGGRTYSFNENDFQTEIDNGQHILMGCYNYTFDFLKTIDALDRVEFQKNLNVNFVNHKGEINKLSGDKLFYPISLLIGILRYKALSVKERISILNFFLKILITKPNIYRNFTTLELLKKFNQTENSVKSFWEIIHVGTLNTDLKLSSAELFVRILKTIFFTGNHSTKIVLPKFGLSKVFIENAVSFLERNGSEISLSERVTDFKINEGSIKKVVTNKREIVNFDKVVLSVPQFALNKFDSITESLNIDFELKYSPILSVHIWLNENPFNEKFYGLIDSDIHWIFNHNKHVTLVTSSAERFMNQSEDEISEKFIKELETRFSDFNKNKIIGLKIIKEKRATFIPSVETEEKRLNLKRMFGNLIISGDWTNTELPSTIEGAIKSGFLAASEIKKEY